MDDLAERIEWHLDRIASALETLLSGDETCAHARTEPLTGFGPAGGQDRCLDCGEIIGGTG